MKGLRFVVVVASVLIGAGFLCFGPYFFCALLILACVAAMSAIPIAIYLIALPRLFPKLWQKSFFRNAVKSSLAGLIVLSVASFWTRSNPIVPINGDHISSEMHAVISRAQFDVSSQRLTKAVEENPQVAVANYENRIANEKRLEVLTNLNFFLQNFALFVLVPGFVAGLVTLSTESARSGNSRQASM